MTNEELYAMIEKLDAKIDIINDTVHTIDITLKIKEKTEIKDWDKQKRNLDIKLIVWGLIISAINLTVVLGNNFLRR